MRGDGKIQFYRLLDIDKKTMQIIYAIREIKTQMLNEKDGAYYIHGKTYIEKE